MNNEKHYQRVKEADMEWDYLRRNELILKHLLMAAGPAYKGIKLHQDSDEWDVANAMAMLDYRAIKLGGEWLMKPIDFIYGVLAHEVGHFIYDKEVGRSFRFHKTEYGADYYSGILMNKCNVSIKPIILYFLAQDAILKRSWIGSLFSTHPVERERANRLAMFL